MSGYLKQRLFQALGTPAGEVESKEKAARRRLETAIWEVGPLYGGRLCG
jgi:hypothetical protein